MIDRITTLMANYDLTPTELADKINVGKSNVSHILSGRNNPSLDIIKKILAVFPDISTDWLLFGIGEMYKPAPSTPKMKTDNPSPELPFMDFDDNTETKSTSKTITDINNTKHQTSHTNNNKPNDSLNQNNNEAIKSEQIKNNINTKQINKIVIFYSDNTYQTFDPSNNSMF